MAGGECWKGTWGQLGGREGEEEEEGERTHPSP